MVHMFKMIISPGVVSISQNFHFIRCQQREGYTYMVHIYGAHICLKGYYLQAFFFPFF